MSFLKLLVMVVKQIVHLTSGSKEPKGAIAVPSAPIEPEKPVVKVRPSLKNDNPRLLSELDDLDKKNPELYDLILDLCEHVKSVYCKEVVITQIFRTQEEQDELYKDSEKYKAKKFYSPHQFFHSIDLRSSTFEKSEIDGIVKYLNDKYNDKNYYKPTSMYHEVSNHGLHFHIQFSKKPTK